MSLFRKNPIFATALTICGVVVAGECYLIYDRIAASRDAAQKLAAKETELFAMRDLMPVPSRKVATAIEEDLARAQHAVTAMQAELKGKGPAAQQLSSAKPPAARTEAYFDLATFVEKTRALAKKYDVEIRPEAARLGFAYYANEGPKEDRMAAVFHQRQVIQYILESLIEARPRAIFSVQREKALNKPERDAIAFTAATNAALAAGATPPDPLPEPPAGSTSAPETDGPDIFTIDPRVTARAPGFIDTTPVRLVFTAQTGALRTFLNKLATFELPILVREVEVDRATAEESVAAQTTAAEEAPAAEDASAASIVIASVPKTPAKATPATVASVAQKNPSAPMIAKTVSKFTVILEYLDPVAPVVPATAAVETPAATPAPETKPTT
jgi:hypothetical protein